MGAGGFVAVPPNVAAHVPQRLDRRCQLATTSTRPTRASRTISEALATGSIRASTPSTRRRTAGSPATGVDRDRSRRAASAPSPGIATSSSRVSCPNSASPSSPSTARLTGRTLHHHDLGGRLVLRARGRAPELTIEGSVHTVGPDALAAAPRGVRHTFARPRRRDGARSQHPCTGRRLRRLPAPPQLVMHGLHPSTGHSRHDARARLSAGAALCDSTRDRTRRLRRRSARHGGTKPVVQGSGSRPACVRRARPRRRGVDA